MENYTCSFPNGVGVLNQYFSPAEEAQLYLNTGRGFFSILLDKGEDKKQTSYPLESLPMVLDALQGYHGNVWISQAAFRCPNRRQANFSRIGLCFLDIDAYSKPWSKGLSPEEMASAFACACVAEGIPLPSYIVFSGRGVQPKWLLNSPLPKAALPRWKAVEKHLVKTFSSYGADPQAKDASRVLRVLDTCNTKSGEFCRIVWGNRPDGEFVRYSFDDFADAVLPLTREQCRDQKQIREQKRIRRSQASPTGVWSAKLLNQRRLDDLETLISLRGGIREGQRMTFLMYGMTFMAHARLVTPETFRAKAADLARRIDPAWTFSTDELGTVFRKFTSDLAGNKSEFHGRPCSALYTAKTETLIEVLEITEDEQRWLKTLISAPLRAERKAERDSRRHSGIQTRQDYEAHAAARRERAVEMRLAGKTLKAIADELKVSVRQVSNYVRVITQKSAAPCLMAKPTPDRGPALCASSKEESFDSEQRQACRQAGAQAEGRRSDRGSGETAAGDRSSSAVLPSSAPEPMTTESIAEARREVRPDSRKAEEGSFCSGISKAQLDRIRKLALKKMPLQLIADLLFLTEELVRKVLGVKT